MEKVLSFDVGIIHLAYCLLSKKEDTNGKLNWEITDWAIIDLADRESHKCTMCNKVASLVQEYQGPKYYCKVHSRNIISKPSDYEFFFKPLEKKQINGCNYGEPKCDKNCTLVDSKNITYCGQHAKKVHQTLTNEMKIVKIKKKSVSSLDFDDTRLKLVMELEKRKHLLEANVVVIENQPSFKNPRMKSISGIIYDYFMIRGLVDKAITKSTITKVKFMSPSNKIKLASDGETQQIVKLKADSEDSKAYKLTKSLAVKYTQEMVKHLPFWLNDFNSHKKKDDLADAFLQGAYYYEMNINTDKDNVYKKKTKVEKTVENNNDKDNNNDKEEDDKDDEKPKGKVIRKTKMKGKKEIKIKKSTKSVNLPNIIINIDDKEINI